MKKHLKHLIFIFVIALTACRSAIPSGTPIYRGSDLSISTPVTTNEQNPADATEEPTATTSTLATTPTLDPFSTFYNCDMQIAFTSGPLESKSTEFKVLGLDYFQDKGDRFDPGKGTSIYYEAQHYFIIHSSFVNGNILRPMQAEFLRKYLEYWGESGSKYVEGQIQNLIGSEATWICDGTVLFTTKINGIVRLSHVESNDVWLNPENLQRILFNSEVNSSDRLGEMSYTSEPHLYLGFCGWGSQSSGDERFTYYRYIFQFIIE